MLKPLFKFFAVAALGIACGAIAMVAYQAAASSSFFAVLGGDVFGVLHSSSALAIAPPERLIIPRIHVDAPIKPVGIDAKGNLGVPADAVHAAWYKNGPRPGAPGVALMDGHLDTKYAPQAVFYNLDELKRGDAVDVRTADGATVAFTVTGVRTLPYNASTGPIFYSTSTVPQLVLITCTGDWVPAKHLYNERLVVFAKEK